MCWGNAKPEHRLRGTRLYCRRQNDTSSALSHILFCEAKMISYTSEERYVMYSQQAKKKKKKTEKRNRACWDGGGLKFTFYSIWGKTRKNWGSDPWECLGRSGPGGESNKCKGPRLEHSCGVLGAAKGPAWLEWVTGGNSVRRGTWGSKGQTMQGLICHSKALDFSSKQRVLSEYNSNFKRSLWLYCERMKWTRASAGDQTGFAEGLDVGWERDKEAKADPSF